MAVDGVGDHSPLYLTLTDFVYAVAFTFIEQTTSYILYGNYAQFVCLPDLIESIHFELEDIPQLIAVWYRLVARIFAE